MKFALFQTASGSPILIGEHGIIIEPEPNTGRSIVTMPHNMRDGKAKIIVDEPFYRISKSLATTFVWSDQPEPLTNEHEPPFTVDLGPTQPATELEEAPVVTDAPWGPDVGAEMLEEIVAEAKTRTKAGRKKK